MLYTLKMTLSGSESPPGHCPWTPGRWRCASLASLTPLTIIIHNYFPPLRLGWLQPWLELIPLLPDFYRWPLQTTHTRLRSYQTLRASQCWTKGAWPLPLPQCRSCPASLTPLAPPSPSPRPISSSLPTSWPLRWHPTMPQPCPVCRVVCNTSNSTSSSISISNSISNTHQTWTSLPTCCKRRCPRTRATVATAGILHIPRSVRCPWRPRLSSRRWWRDLWPLQCLARPTR